MTREYVLFFKDILEAIESIEGFVSGLSFEDFLGNDMARSAVVRKLEIIGEAVKNLPPHVPQRYPDIPWRSMAKMRDRLSHGYWTVDYEIVWKVVKEEISALKPRLQKVYHQEQSHA